jgi:hypothetical protein
MGGFGTTNQRPVRRWRDDELVENHPRIRAGGVTGTALTIVSHGREHTVAIVWEWSFGRRHIARPWLVCPGCLQRRRYLYPKGAAIMCATCAGYERACRHRRWKKPGVARMLDMIEQRAKRL